MFSHVRVGSNDLEKSRAFYDSALGALGIQGKVIQGMLVYSHAGNMLAVAAPREGAARAGNGGTIGFNAPSDEAVNAFHVAGIANGGTSEGAPGPRTAADGKYGAYLRDPDGNKLCAFNWG